GIRLIQGRAGCLGAVTAITLDAAASHRGNLAGFQVNPADAVVECFRDVEVPATIDVAVKWLLKLGFGGQPAIAGVAGLSCTGQGLDVTRRCGAEAEPDEKDVPT